MADLSSPHVRELRWGGCGRASLRNLQFCGITEEDVEDLGACFDRLGRSKIEMM